MSSTSLEQLTQRFYELEARYFHNPVPCPQTARSDDRQHPIQYTRAGSLPSHGNGKRGPTDSHQLKLQGSLHAANGIAPHALGLGTEAAGLERPRTAEARDSFQRRIKHTHSTSSSAARHDSVLELLGHPAASHRRAHAEGLKPVNLSSRPRHTTHSHSTHARTYDPRSRSRYANC